MRFEVLKRDAEIACWKAVADGGDRANSACVRAPGLLGACSTRSSPLSPSATRAASSWRPTRSRACASIAARTWTRTLDDRLGLSREEKQRKARSPAAALPAIEPLLADKPEHVFERADARPHGPRQPLGLQGRRCPSSSTTAASSTTSAIGRGTLTTEDRYKINEHMVQTIIML